MRTLSSLAFSVLIAVPAFAQVNFDEAALGSDLKLSHLFPRQSYLGPVASNPQWSKDDRYLLYTWNPYDTMGGQDMWLYDARSKKSTRVTSIEMFAEIDAEAQKAIGRYAKDRADRDRRNQLGDKEYREEVQKVREENEKRREPLPSYPGIGEYEWSNKGHEILFTYRGDIFRWKVGDKAPTRVTKTKENESALTWLPDDSGFTYVRGGIVFRSKFGDNMIEQISPDLPAGVQFGGYHMSPDGNRMMVQGFKPGPQERSVDYIVYRGRFAEARKTARGVSDDDFSGEQYIFVFNIADNAKGDGKPTEVWKWAGGEEFQETSIDDKPWSPDSKRLTFASWKRDKKELIVHVVDCEAKKVANVFKTTSDGEHRTPSLCSPRFSPDGTEIMMLLDTSGYRQVHLLDLNLGGARQLTVGAFETYPLQYTPDGKNLLVRACKEGFPTMDVYRVNIANGEMTRVTKDTGNYDNAAMNHAGTMGVSIFRSWSKLPELTTIGEGGESAITKSHNSDAFFRNIKVKPQLITYKNRNGQTIHGYMFQPPYRAKGDKRPLMVYVYGGPLGIGKSVNIGDFNSSAFMFNMYLTHVLGYVTVTIDPRGQSGYGAAFGKANWEQVGVPQTEDLSDGVKYLVENFDVDAKKVAINGWSFGGFQTQMCLYTAPEVFTLGIAGAGPTEWQNYNTWYVGGVVGNAPKGNPEPIDKYSLTHLAKNLRSPLLLLHGVEDTNVLFQDTIKVYRELLQAGKGHLVELSIDPTGGHGMGGDMNTLDRHSIYLSFILKHWGLPEKN